MLAKSIDIAVVDENPLFVRMLENYLLEHNAIRIASYATALSALRPKEKTAFDVLLIDGACLKWDDVYFELEAFKNNNPGIKILVLGLNTDTEMISSLLDTGIHGYFLKSSHPAELTEAITTLSDKGIYRNELFTEALYWGRKHGKSICDQQVPVLLNSREKKVLQMLWEEKSNKEIADALFLSIRSIEKIRQDMKEKLNIRSTVGLLRYAVERNIVSVRGAYAFFSGSRAS